MIYRVAISTRDRFRPGMKRKFKAALHDYNTVFLSRTRQANSVTDLTVIASQPVSTDRMRKAYYDAYYQPAKYFSTSAYKAADKVKALNPWSEERFNSWLRNYSSTTLGKRIEEVTTYTRERYIEIVQQTVTDMPNASINEITEALQERLGIEELYRAERIARTEVISAANVGSNQGIKEIMDGEAYMKIWIATRDDRTRDTHLDMDGKEVMNLHPFVLPSGVELNEPGDPNCRVAAEVINCRCSIAYDLID